MKKILLMMGIILCQGVCFAQVSFNYATNWNEIVKKAKAQNKYIFVDCYATWCGPCKMMDQEVFSNAEVGKLMNARYVNIKLQFDSTKKDSKAILATFPLVRQIEKQYAVRGYPTYLFFSPDGKLVKQIGTVIPTTDFLKMANDVLDPNKDYQTLKKRFQNGDKNEALLKVLVPEAVRLNDMPIAQAAHEDYVNMLKPPYKKEEVIGIYGSIKDVKSRGFELLIKYGDQFDRLLDDGGRVTGVLKAHLWRAVDERFLKNNPNPDFDAIGKFIEGYVPRLKPMILLELKKNIALMNKDFELWSALQLDYYDQFAWNFDHNDKVWVNNTLMDIFRKSNNKETLLRAAAWSKITIYRDPEIENTSAIDTYANLLYKAGKVSDAIKWQQYAIDKIADDPERKARFTQTVEKMKKGIATWTRVD